MSKEKNSIDILLESLSNEQWSKIKLRADANRAHQAVERYKANTHLIPPHFRNQDKEFEDKYVPTKLITLIYNNETIESYE